MRQLTLLLLLLLAVPLGAAQDFATNDGHYMARPVTAYPVTMHVRFKTNNATITNFPRFISLNDGSADCSSTDCLALELTPTTGTQKVRIHCEAEGTPDYTQTTSTYTVQVWQAVTVVFVSPTDRTIYFKGNSDNDTTSCDPWAGTDSIDELQLGGDIAGCPGSCSVTQDYDGDLAEVYVWAAGLSAGEAHSLNNWVSPLTTRPAGLVACVDLVRQLGLNDICGGASLTAVGTPTVSTHAPIYGRGD
jgi:hypothetical protein